MQTFEFACLFAVQCLAMAESLCDPPMAGRRAHGILRPPNPVVSVHVGILGANYPTKGEIGSNELRSSSTYFLRERNVDMD